MKIQIYETFNTQIEILPRLSIMYGNGISVAFEWLFWGIHVILKEEKYQ